jgi:hypothetical protein
MIRLAFRTSLARIGKSSDSRFIDGFWQEAVDDLYSRFEYDSSYNPGQQAILAENKEAIYNYLFQNGDEYDPNNLLNFLENLLGDAKYAALSETWSTFSEELLDAWDHATGGDGVGGKKFMGVEYD